MNLLMVKGSPLDCASLANCVRAHLEEFMSVHAVVVPDFGRELQESVVS